MCTSFDFVLDIPFVCESNIVALLQGPLMENSVVVVDGFSSVHTISEEERTLKGFLSKTFGHDGPYPVNSELFVQLVTHNWKENPVLVLVLTGNCLSYASSKTWSDKHESIVLLHSPYKSIRKSLAYTSCEFKGMWLLRTTDGYIGLSHQGIVKWNLGQWSGKALDMIEEYLLIDPNAFEATTKRFLRTSYVMGQLKRFRVFECCKDLFEYDEGSRFPEPYKYDDDAPIKAQFSRSSETEDQFPEPHKGDDVISVEARFARSSETDDQLQGGFVKEPVITSGNRETGYLPMMRTITGNDALYARELRKRDNMRGVLELEVPSIRNTPVLRPRSSDEYLVSPLIRRDSMGLYNVVNTILCLFGSLGRSPDSTPNPPPKFPPMGVLYPSIIEKPNTTNINPCSEVVREMYLPITDPNDPTTWFFRLCNLELIDGEQIETGALREIEPLPKIKKRTVIKKKPTYKKRTHGNRSNASSYYRFNSGR